MRNYPHTNSHYIAYNQAGIFKRSQTQPEPPVKHEHPYKDHPLFRQPVANQRVHSMIARTEAPELHLLPILDLFRVTVAPLHWHIGVRIGVYQNVERTVAIELREECDGCCDLPEYGLDFFLDLLFRLLGWWFRASVSLSAGVKGRGPIVVYTQARRSLYLLISLKISTLRTC